MAKHLRLRLEALLPSSLGVLASALLVVLLPIQLAGLFGGSMSWASSATWLVWLPMLLFEVGLAFWFMIKGVSPQPDRGAGPAPRLGQPATR